MKTNGVRAYSLLLTASGFVFVSGCVVVQTGPVEVVRPQPVVVETVMVPSSYVIVDGEYYGWVGDRYYYLGAGNVWLVCDAIRLERFHYWQRSHHDWREHAIRNDRYRRDAQGYEHPRHDDPHAHQPGHSDPRMLPGRNSPHAVQPSPGQINSRTQPGHNGQPIVQPGQSHVNPTTQSGRKDERVHAGYNGSGVPQSVSGAPTKATSKKGTEKDEH